MKMSAMDWIAWILLFVGGLNWGLIGGFNFDLVAKIFGGSDSTISRIVFVLVGLAALWSLFSMFTKGDGSSPQNNP